jgi:DNA replication licensing factor MCM7
MAGKAKLIQYDEALEENGTPMKLVSSIENNAKHYLDIFCKAVDKIMPDPTREIK